MTIRNDRLRRLRQRTGLKVGAFAELVECSAPHLTSCENGNRAPSPELAERIATVASRLLGRTVTVGEFVPTPPPEQPKGPKAPRKDRGKKEPKGPKRPGSELAAAS